MGHYIIHDPLIALVFSMKDLTPPLKPKSAEVNFILARKQWSFLCDGSQKTQTAAANVYVCI